MIAAIILMVSASTLGAFMYNRLVGACLFLTLIPLLPRYMAIGIGQDGVALTVLRLLVIGLSSIIVISSFVGGDKNLLLIKDSKKYIVLLFLLYTISALGSVLYGELVYGLFYFVEDTAILIVSVYLGCLFASHRRGLKLLVNYCFLLPLMITVVIVFIEMSMQQPVLTNVFVVDTNIASNREFFNYHSFRDGVYRAKGLFDGSLQLGEFATYCGIVSIIIFMNNSYSRKFSGLCILMSIYLAYSSGSRSAFLVLVIVGVLLFFVQVIKRNREIGKHFTWASIFFAVVCGGLILTALVMEVRGIRFLYLIEDAKERSTVGRLLQYYIVPSLILDSPIYGYGYRRYYVYLFERLTALDNYYLRILLQAGYSGLLVYVGCLFYMLKKTIEAVFSSDKNLTTAGIFTFGVLFCVVLSKVFIAGDSNVFYFIILFTFLAARSRLISLN